MNYEEEKILDAKLEELEEVLGTKELLDAITQALGTAELNDIADYIYRCYDIKYLKGEDYE